MGANIGSILWSSIAIQACLACHGAFVEPRPEGIPQSKGFAHALGEVGPAGGCGSEIAGNRFEGGLEVVIDGRMQWEENCIFWLEAA